MSHSFKTIAVIPARFGSTRFPGKPLADILGRPMLSWVLDACTSCKDLSEIIVATDDPRIAKVAQEHKHSRVIPVTVEMTDPNLATGTDRVRTALGSRECDLVLNIQGDEPLLETTALTDLIELMKGDSRISMGTLATQLEPSEISNPNTVKVLVNEEKHATYFSRFPIPFSRVPAADHDHNPMPGLFKHIGLYAFRPAFLSQFCNWPQGDWEKAESLEQLRVIQRGFQIGVHAGHYPLIAVDHASDIPKVESVLRSRM